MRRALFPLFPLCLAAASIAAGYADESNKLVTPAATNSEILTLFEGKVRPLLIAKCFACHGETVQQSGLRLDSRATILKGGKRGSALHLDKPDESPLLQSVHQTGELKMPPSGKLRPDEIAALTAWVRQGALWPEAGAEKREKGKGKSAAASPLHWAFLPVRKPSVPAPLSSPLRKGGQRGVIENPIDAFILAKLEARGVSLALPADRRTLLRRVTYNLTGLPPTPEEVEAFVGDRSPKAYAKVVDRLLASPRYGEQWGRKWLDVVRYADTAGENTDHPLPHAWRYRNWVIKAFNDNKPYDEFIREQIAGDLIAAQGPSEKYADRVVATGYLAIARRFGHDIDKDMHLTYEDTIDTLGKSVLGLTLGCARCHDHKFDPISAKDYYGLYGIFDSTKFSFPGCEPNQQPRDLVSLLSPEQFSRTIKPLQEKAAQWDARIQQMTAAQNLQVRELKAKAQQSAVLLSSGEIADSMNRDMAEGAKRSLDRITVRRGDVLLLSVAPRGNHGADSTRVEFVITELGGQKRQWSVADLVAGIPEANPHADHYGNAVTWCFLDAQDGYRFLPESMQSIEGQRTLQGWRNGDTPSVFVNTSDQPVPVWTTLPPHSFFMHPGPKGPVALAWLSPIDGEVQITGRIADAHTGGDGIGWTLEYFSAVADSFAALGEQNKALQAAGRSRTEITDKLTVPVAFAVTEGEAKNARIQKRGEPTDLGEETPRRFLAVLGGQAVQKVKSSGRQELAEWLTRPMNPLTARVFVNRVWQGHFGRGIVKTPNDFGTRGAAPTHPELLDYLANEFMRSGWNIKALHRLILLSKTYRAASTLATNDQRPTTKAVKNSVGRSSFVVRQAHGAHDGNTTDLYAGFPRRRLTAEELRDSLLYVSGELDLTPGEAHPFPPEVGWVFTQHAPFAAEYDTMKRSVYVMQKRNRRIRFFALFDGPDPNASTPVRDVTTVPTQALFFLNDSFLHARADKFITRILAAASTEQERLDFAFHQIFGRRPSKNEVSEASTFLNDYALGMASQPTEEHRRLAWAAFIRVLLSSNEFLYVD